MRLSYIHIICPLILNQRYSPVNSRNSNPHFPYIVTSPPLLPASPSWRPCNHLKGQSSHRMHPTGFTYAKGPKPRAQTHPNYCRAVTLSFSGGYSTDYQCKPQSPLVFQSCISSAFLSKKKKIAAVHLKGPRREEYTQGSEIAWNLSKFHNITAQVWELFPQCLLLCHVQQPRTNTPFRPRLLPAFAFISCSSCKTVLPSPFFLHTHGNQE